MKCDPNAEIFKLKFKKNKDSLVSVLFKLFNEEVFDNKVNIIYISFDKIYKVELLLVFLFIKCI